MPSDLKSLTGLRQSFDTGGVQFDIVKPFGPTLLETVLPDDVLAALRALTDALLDDGARTSWGAHLVGQIAEEPQIPEPLLREAGVYDYLVSVFREYVMGCMYADSPPDYKAGVDDLRRRGQMRNPIDITLESAWVVSQQAGEYNPIHQHSGATLSSVLYLNVPETLQTDVLPNKPAVDGFIEFVDGAHADPLRTSTTRVRPRAGLFYVFPASLLHLVYPFSVSGERRSVSINASHALGA